MFTTSYTYITWIHRIAMNSTTIHHILSHGVPLHLFAMWFEVLVVIVLNIIILLFEEVLVICAALDKCFPVGFCPAWPLPIRFPENGNAYTHMYIYIYTHVRVCVCVNHLNRCKTSTLIGGIVFPYQVLCHEYFTRRLSNLLFICRGW